MTKTEFLDELRKRLSGLPQSDLEERLLYFREMIDDRMEDGLTEEEAVSGIGSVDEIVDQIAEEIPLSKLVKESAKRKGSPKAWEIVLLVLGAPLWLPLILAAFAVCLSLYAAAWALVLGLWASAIGLAAGAVAGLVVAAGCLVNREPVNALFTLGAAILCAGLAILLCCGCIWLTRGSVRMTKKMILGMKAMLMGKGDQIQ